MRKICCLLLTGVLFFTGSACIPGGEEKLTSTPASVSKESPATAPKAAWGEARWDKTVAEGKREGSVYVYSSWGPLVRIALSEAFTRKYGIDIEWVSFGRGAEMVARIQREKIAGLKIADVYGTGSTTLIAMVKPLGLLGPMPPFLVLPEVLDARVWRGNQLPFVDKDKLAIAMSLRLTNNITVNKEIINPGEITSVKDLLKPQYKDKITINDPTVSGSGNAVLASLAYNEWNEAEALKFLKDLLAHGAVVTRDYRLPVEWMARGKYPLSVGAQADSLADFLEAGAPLAPVVTKEGLSVTPGAGAIALPLEFAHPNAATVFLNWLLSKDGQTAFIKGTKQPITRMDVPVEEIHPMFLPSPQQKLYFQTEEFLIYQGDFMKPAAEILAAAK